MTTSQFHTPKVSVVADGHIELDGKRLTQHEAIETASRLAQAVEDSIWRTQKAHNSGWYHDSMQILARSESKLGKAISALRKVYH
jgi:hypothetical protein